MEVRLWFRSVLFQYLKEDEKADRRVVHSAHPVRRPRG